MQHDARMVAASQVLYDAIVEGRLLHPDDPQLNRHVVAAVARHTRRGWRTLEVHHLDEDPSNNARENLEVRCRPCHRPDHGDARSSAAVSGSERRRAAHRRRLSE